MTRQWGADPDGYLPTLPDVGDRERPALVSTVLFVLLAVVAVAAGVLSFAALRDLAERCGFDPMLSWLLPVVLDAGAAAGSVAWLSQPPGGARQFGRRLAVALLVVSVLGNGVAHLLGAYALVAPWWLLVAVSALAPAVLAACIHLAVLTAQARTERPQMDEGAQIGGPPTVDTPDDERGIGPAPGSRLVQVDDQAVSRSREDQDRQETRSDSDAVSDLIASGAGSRTVARRLGTTRYAAEKLIASHRNGHLVEGVAGDG